MNAKKLPVKTRVKRKGRSQARYARIATGAGYDANRPEPVAHAASLGYSEEELKTVPAEGVMSLGCGNPSARAGLREGESVLDLGSGGGLDAFLAARQVGPSGRVIGVDATVEMVMRARASARKAKLANVEFKHAAIERLPLDDGSIDVAISNCVMNHCRDKVQAFREVYRVLKVSGRMCIADLVIAGTFSEAALQDEVWGEWLRTAQSKREYLRAIKQAGFEDVTVQAEATFPMAESDARLKGRIASLVVTARKR